MDLTQRKFHEILELSVKNGDSDIHITSGVEPYMRLQSEVRPMSDEVLTPFAVEQMAMSMMTDHQRQTFADNHNLDFAFFSDEGSRYRVNVFRQRGTVAMSIRHLDNDFRSLDELTLPPQLLRLAEHPLGGNSHCCCRRPH